MAKPSPSSRRAALQAQREAAERARRRGRLIGAVCGALAAVLLLTIVVWQFNKDDEPVVAAGSQVAVPGAAPDGRGITLAKTPAGKPMVVVIEDYQCPWCKIAEQSIGKQVKALADKGEVGYEVRSVALLDTMLKNDSSERANLAAACADLSGHYAAYRDTVFANQPQKEGEGFTDEQLRTGFAEQAGITGDDLERFQTCYDQRQTNDHVQSVLKRARADKIDDSTPQYWVAAADGSLTKKLDLEALMGTADPTEQQVLDAIKAAA
ncbi:DsbA family protein [Luteococcus peritonei]|uniref:DsbA family protein n=1 Tax=Luteococcus peritonei TaxID=88874 RepID=A0ABW4RVG1_9ACTN